MERARLDGVELEYEVRGTGEPVLLIHGSHVARSFVSLLEQEILTSDYMLIRYHRQGWLGSSSPPGKLSLADQAADARKLLDFLEIELAHVVGHSYGGPIAMQLTHDSPEHVHTLALMEAAIISVPRGKAVKELIKLAGRLYEQGDWEAAEDWFLGTPRERMDIMRNVPGGLEEALADMDTFFKVEAPAHEEWEFGAEEGGKISQPVLFMLGGESSPLYVECSDAVRAWMPQTETVILPGASHLLHIQEPEGAALLLRNFFVRHPLPTGRTAPRAVAHSARVTDGYNATSDLLDTNLELGRAAKVAVRTHDAEWTYGEVSEIVNRTGNALRELGVEAENRVLIAVPDSLAFAAAFFGAIKIGAVPVPVSPVLHADEYAWLIADSRAKVAVVSDPVAALLREADSSGKQWPHLIVTGNHSPGEIGFDEFVAAGDPELSPADTRRDDVGFWLYSSGTTGRAKGVVHLQHDMRFCADAYGKHVLAIDESDTTFSVSRLHFAFGLGGGLYYPFSAGATTVLVAEAPLPRVVLDVTREFRPTIFFGVPSSYASILSASALGSGRMAEFGHVRLFVSGGEALGGTLLARWKKRTGLDILEGMGCTESCHTFISNRPGDVQPDCCGTVVEGYEAKLVDDEDREVPPGNPGILMVKGGSICAYYWHERDLTKAALKGEWLRTGDTFVRDEEGRFHYRGRVDDMLKVGGTWVSPLEVERVLDEHERVASSAVVGVADADGLVRPEAYVVLDGPGGEQQLEGALRHLVRQRLGGDKTPRAFYFVPSLPETPVRRAQREKIESVTLVGADEELDSSLV